MATIYGNSSLMSKSIRGACLDQFIQSTLLFHTVTNQIPLVNSRSGYKSSSLPQCSHLETFYQKHGTSEHKGSIYLSSRVIATDAFLHELSNPS